MGLTCKKIGNDSKKNVTEIHYIRRPNRKRRSGDTQFFFSRSFRSLSWVLVSQAGEKLRKDSSFRLPHGNGFARTFALRTLGCLMVTAFASTLFLRFLTPPIEQ